LGRRHRRTGLAAPKNAQKNHIHLFLLNNKQQDTPWQAPRPPRIGPLRPTTHTGHAHAVFACNAEQITSVRINPFEKMKTCISIPNYIVHPNKHGVRISRTKPRSPGSGHVGASR
jgi:hypothetical protein